MTGIVSTSTTAIAHGQSSVIEVFPKVLNESLIRGNCAEDCLCLGPNYAYIEQLNRELLQMLESVIKETGVKQMVRVYRFFTETDQAEAIRRLSDLLEKQGFSRFDVDKQGMQMLELVTPVIVVDGNLCSFATYPTREKFQEVVSGLSMTDFSHHRS